LRGRSGDVGVTVTVSEDIEQFHSGVANLFADQDKGAISNRLFSRAALSGVSAPRQVADQALPSPGLAPRRRVSGF
jgi:hypothetical protein